GTLLFDWFCQDKKQERCHTRAAAYFRRMAQIACPKFHNSSKKDRENGGGGPGTGEKGGKGVRVSELPFRETGQALGDLVLLQLAVEHGFGQAQQLHGLAPAAAALGQSLAEDPLLLLLQPLPQGELDGLALHADVLGIDELRL